MKYLHDDASIYKESECECGMKTFRKLSINGHEIPICGKCVCELFILSKKQVDGSEVIQ
ncbi:hypothetical protein D3C73_1290760 [compost metagenome]